MKTTTILAALFLAAHCAQAQNFITNGSFEAGNTNFSNDYVYSPANMFGQGTYCVITNPNSVHSQWAAFGDHTTGTGLMLVANGDSNPTNVVWRQTITVATNAGYLFSAWAANSYPGNPASFYFYVNGLPQGNPVALPPDTTGVWQNYSVIWSSSNSVSALLEIRMLNTEFGGNDFVLDDLSFRSITPNAPPPVASIERAVEVLWPSVASQLYQVQWASTLETNQWFSFGAPVVGNGGTNSIFDSLGNKPKRFYRVIPVN